MTEEKDLQVQKLKENMSFGNSKLRDLPKIVDIFMGGTGAGKTTVSLLCGGYTLKVA